MSATETEKFNDPVISPLVVSEPLTTVTIRFSRCAPLTWREKWKYKAFVDMSLWICRLTHSRFSHVDVLLDDGNLLGASDDPYAPIVKTNPPGNPRGVAVRPPDYQRFAIRRDAVLLTTPEIKKAFIDFCVAQLGKPFDGGALKISVFLSPRMTRNWRSSDKWFCAEMAGRATEVSKLVGYEYPGEKNRMTAADLLLYLAPKLNFPRFAIPILTEQQRWEL